MNAPAPGYEQPADAYRFDDAARARAREALARIDKSNARAPRCRLCGQPCLKLDRWDLCSKTGVMHSEARAGVVRFDEGRLP